MPSAWLPVAILIAVGAAFALRTRWVARRIRHSPNRFGAGDTVHDFVGRFYRIGGAVLLTFLIARAVSPGIDLILGPIPVLVRPAIAWPCLMIMAVGGGMILAAQVRMGASWRIGLDRERTSLVTTGLFGWSRNPTFLGMMAVVLGTFLVAPTALTGAVLAAAWVSFSVQVRMEEEHLLRMHGAAYERYRAVVPRWIGRLGPRIEAHAGQGHPADHV